MAQSMREQLVAGKDPFEVKRSEVRKIVIPTFESAARQVHKELSPGWKNKKHCRQWLSTLDQYAFPSLASKSLDVITPADVAETLRPLWLIHPETASRVKQRIHAIMLWG